MTDFEAVTIRELTIDIKRAVDLGLELGIYAYDTYILEAARASGFPLLALDGPIQKNARKLGVSLVEFGPVKLYTYSTARQRLADVLEEASREGEVQIRRQDGRVYAVTPVAKPAESPFANVTGRAVKGVTSKDLIRATREQGWARGGRALRISPTKSGAARSKRRSGSFV